MWEAFQKTTQLITAIYPAAGSFRQTKTSLRTRLIFKILAQLCLLNLADFMRLKVCGTQFISGGVGLAIPNIMICLHPLHTAAPIHTTSGAAYLVNLFGFIMIQLRIGEWRSGC